MDLGRSVFLSLAFVGIVFAQDGWRQAPIGLAPAARSGHGMAFDPNLGQVILFGGQDGIMFDDTWAWDGASWRALSPSTPLSPRAYFSYATDSARGKVVVFGGNRPGAGGLADTWTWDGATWTPRHPQVSPPGRYGASLAYDENRQRAVLTGGRSSNGEFTDTWEWDGSEWSEVASPVQIPQLIDSPMFFDTVGRERPLLFANGFAETWGTWEWTGTSWVALLSPQLSPPRLRAFAAAFDRTRGRGIVFGGQSASTETNDTWEWHVDHWENASWAARPPVRVYHAMAFDPIRGEAVLFGGSALTTGHLDDTWLYRVAITEPATISTVGSGCAGSNGMPSLSVAEGRGPWLGESVKLILANLPTALFAPAFGIIGTTRGSWSGSPIPLDLGRLGAAGCVLQVAPLDALPLARTGGGDATWRVQIPNQPVLLGAEFGVQGLAFDLLANPLGIVLTNAASARVGRR